MSFKQLVAADKRFVTGDKWAVQPLVLLLACFLVSLLLSSCDRRELTYYLESEVTVLVDWSQSRLPQEEASYGATVMFYPEDGGEPKTVLMGSREGEKVYLPEGRYRVLVFNRSFNDFGGVAFRGCDALDTHEAYAKQVETREGS